MSLENVEIKFVRITKEEFDKLEKKDPGTIYFVAPITEENDDEQRG